MLHDKFLVIWLPSGNLLEQKLQQLKYHRNLPSNLQLKDTPPPRAFSLSFFRSGIAPVLEVCCLTLTFFSPFHESTM